ncbi:MAG: FIST signal transduction protein [Opitutaceae bacterium]
MPVASTQCVAQHFSLPFCGSEVESWAKAQVEAHDLAPTFGVLFCSADALPYSKEILELVRIYAHVSAMIGCSGGGSIANAHEFETEGGFCVSLYYLPNTQAEVVRLPSELFEAEDTTSALRSALAEQAERANAWMLFASSESFHGESWLTDWDVVTGGSETIGGFACDTSDGGTGELYMNGDVYFDGAVALSLSGAVTIETVLSQGCRPVGSAWTVTQAEHNVIHQIGNRPILEVLRDTLEGMSRKEQQLARGNIFIGLVLDEYKQDLEAGDFLVRNLAGIDPKTGAVAIATPLRIGQNLQFQIRDAHTASIDLEALLRERMLALGKRSVYGACLCDCIGRGSSLFGVPDHDVSVIREIIPGLNVGGVFCNGEFATVDGRTLLHGYAASLALFVERE